MKNLNFEGNIRIAQKVMETRPGCRVHAIIVTTWSTSCLQKLLSLHKKMQVGVQSYKTDDRDREYIV